ncbi:chymotrypsin-2 [Solenopsis invicta]|uniref:chymotrypsin-2 n=1 Tax=Solenopsis invicta TaxID=13686 RepID=UPI000E33DB60|nr:chymotrypsin-2 [Solenopsis invicta]
MAFRTLCLLSLLAFSHAGVLQQFSPKIVDGEDAKKGEIPYQVSLQEKDSSFHFCGGSILNDYYVITAAHCVDGMFPRSIQVVAGIINLSDIKKSIHNVVKIVMHPKYNEFDSYVNDIALIKVKTPFKNSTTVKPVPLPSKNYVVKANDVAVVSGWGSKKVNGPTTTKLQRVNVLITDHKKCKSIYRKVRYDVYSTQICANDPTFEKGSCQGDSGGPLTVRGKLVGLVSWAIDCARTDYPTVFTNVISYLNWIKKNAV